MTTYQELKELCEQAGITLGEVCRAANVDRSIMERWKRKEPKTLQILRAIKAAIQQKEAAETAVQPEETKAVEADDKWI